MYFRKNRMEGCNIKCQTQVTEAELAGDYPIFLVHSVRQLRVHSLGNSLILGQYANPSQDYTPGSVCVPILPINSERRDGERTERDNV